jgi:hypothetical protein
MISLRLVRALATPHLVFACLVAAAGSAASGQVEPAPAATLSSPALAGLPFQPEFTVIFRADDPKALMRPGGVPGVSYNTPTWQVDARKASSLAIKRDVTEAGDGFDETILDGAMRNRAHNLFDAGAVSVLRPREAVRLPDGRIRFLFPEHEHVDLEAYWSAEGAGDFPVLEVSATRKTSGWISIGYTGAPRIAESEAEEGWQPIIWTERRFPAIPYLTSGHMTPLPATLVRSGGITYGVVADPAELPFQPLPLFNNVRFGVALRSADGALSPMVFAPMLGGAGSKGAAGERVTFRHRLVAIAGDVPHAFEMIARQLYGFRDQRHNAIGSLNATLDNMVSYSKTDYAWFVDRLKGCSYSTDVPDAVKNVSSLNPLSLAFVKDDPYLFHHRAKPILEYLLSREKFLFSLDPKQRIQSPSRSMTGPSAPLSEMTAWHRATGGASGAYLETAEALLDSRRVLNLEAPTLGDTWWNRLALYRATGERRWLEQARQGADAYLEARVARPATNFVDEDSIGFFFWPGFTPRWIELLLLHEATGEARYLEAAHRGARLYSLFTWMAPRVPDELVTVNPQGVAPHYWYLARHGYPPIPAAKEEVPAWRVSEIGLTAESSGTSSGHRGIFMTNYAPWMLRIAALTGDRFLHDIARWAVVGRYQNFPGYHMNTGRTTVYEKADYPLRPHDQLSYNSIHYNHILPMASLMLDYLVSDIWAKSGGAIDFPSEYIEGYAYLQSRFYGHAPGRLYDVEGVRLWMPDGLLSADSPELNFLSGHTESGFVVAFANQSAGPVRSRVRVNSAHFVRPPGPGSSVRRWVDNRETSPGSWSDGGIEIEVPAHGIAAIHVDGVKPRIAFERNIRPATAPRAGVLATGPGDARAMILSAGEDRCWAYIYLREDDLKWRSVRLLAKMGGRDIELVDDKYPFEFDFPISASEEPIIFRLEATDLAGRTEAGPEQTLKR